MIRNRSEATFRGYFLKLPLKLAFRETYWEELPIRKCLLFRFTQVAQVSEKCLRDIWGESGKYLKVSEVSEGDSFRKRIWKVSEKCLITFWNGEVAKANCRSQSSPSIRNLINAPFKFWKTSEFQKILSSKNLRIKFGIPDVYILKTWNLAICLNFLPALIQKYSRVLTADQNDNR